MDYDDKLKKIPGYSNYSVTTSGKVLTNRLRAGEMKPTIDRAGYLRISMIGDTGKRKAVYVHQAVAMAFLANPENKLQVNHIDNNPSNNQVCNLEWCTAKENRLHAATQNRLPRLSGENNGNAKYTARLINIIRSRHKNGMTQTDIAKMFSIPQPTVSVIVRKIQWRNI